MDGQPRSPKPKPLASPPRQPAAPNPVPRSSAQMAKPEPAPARKATSVKPLRIEPEAATPPAPATKPAPQRISSRGPQTPAQPAPRKISSHKLKPQPAAEKPQIKIEQPKAAPAPVAPPAPVSAPAAKAESKREQKAETTPKNKAPFWASKKIAGALIVLIVLLSGTAVALAMKLRGGSKAPVVVVDESHENGGGTGSDSHDSDSSVVHQVKLPVGLHLPKRRLNTRTNLLLARGGAVPTASGNPQFLNDGDSTNYDGNTGYASTDNNNPKDIMQITLKEPQEMNRVRFLLWDKDDRTYRYILSVSPDGTKFNTIQDNSNKESRSWQEVRFEKQKVKVVAIKGIANTSNNQLHVVEVEGYNDGDATESLLLEGFETPGVGAGVFKYNPQGTNWTFDGQSGISANASGFTNANPVAPEGAQVAFIQGNGTIKKEVTLAAGTYSLSFLDAQRGSGQQSFQIVRVTVDSQTVGEFKPAGAEYQAESKTFTVSAGKHTITFAGLNPNGGDNTILIDNIIIRSQTAVANTHKRTPSKRTAKSVDSLKPGIWAEFFDGIDSYASADDIPDLTRAQDGLDFCASTPAAANQGLHSWPFYGPCAAVFTGFVKIDKPGVHTFFLASENGSRLYLDGVLLVDNDGDHPLQETWEQIDLAPGLHRLWIEYYTLGAATGLTVSIKPKGDSREPLSSKMLFYDPAENGKPQSTTRKDGVVVDKAQVKFLSRDDKRGGVWQKDLGKDGYVIFNKNGGGQHLQKLPPYILSLNSYADHCVWQVGQDPRGLEEPAGGGQRLCSCEYSGNDVLIEIKAARNSINRLSLYCLDFDPCGRKQKVQFSDGDKVLHEMDVGDMGKGTWLHYEVAGSLTLRLQNMTATNAVIAGVFWDSDKGVKFRAPQKGPPTNENVQPGLVSEYFDGLATYPTEDDVVTFTRLEPTVAFGATPPPSGGRELHNWPLSGACAALFHGCIRIPQDEKYTFVLESDDGSRFYVDGAKLIDNDGAHGMKKVEGSIDLKAGLHGVWVEWYNSGGPMGLNLFIKKDGKELPIPSDMLFHE